MGTTTATLSVCFPEKLQYSMHSKIKFLHCMEITIWYTVKVNSYHKKAKSQNILCGVQDLKQKNL